MQARARAIFLAALAAGALALAPNALWLARSSAVVYNRAAEPIELQLVLGDEIPLLNRLGRVRPGGSRFTWLAARGEATLYVELRDEDGWQRHCGEYVEGSMYRVEVVIRATDEIACTIELAPLDRLLLADIVF